MRNTDQPTTPATPPGAGSAVARRAPGARPNIAVRVLANTWFGVGVLAALLFYAAIGSALPQVRGALEMTEMQVFRHWLFGVLVALLFVSVLVASLARIAWNAVNAGALLTHAGLLLLVGGAFWYFATKVEGDTLLLSPRIELRTGDGHLLPDGALLAEAGQRWAGRLPETGELVGVEVREILGNATRPVVEARVRVVVGESPARTLSLRADDAAGVAVGRALRLSLHVFPPVAHFYENEAPALYYRRLNEAPESRRMALIDGLPIHRERYLKDGPPLRDRFDRPVPSKRTTPVGWLESWRLPIRLETPELPFEVTIVGYLPYVAGLRRAEGSQQSGPGDGHAADGNPAPVLEPIIEPIERRRPAISPRSASAICLKLSGRGAHAGWSERRWILFSQYPHIDPRPIHVHLPGSDEEWELIYSRRARELGARLLAGKLSVTFFPGRMRVKAWRSDFYVQAGPGQAVQPAAVYTNQTTRVGRWTLFQSGAAPDHWSYTVLGVGNRNGIWPMLLGSILITLGSLYAFYVKPVLLRRRQRQTAMTAAPPTAGRAAARPAREREPAEVAR